MDNVTNDSFVIVGPEISEAERIARPKVSYLQDVWRRFKENKMALVALIILMLLGFMVIFGPSISGYAFEEVDRTARNQFPSLKHWFGTDKLGRDMFARVCQGGRVSLIIGLAGAFISSVVGCLYGGISAYLGGKIDDIMMRIVEIIISVPYLIVVILLSVVLQSQGIFTLILAMTLTGWCSTARLVRGQVLQIKGQDYVLAAQALGVSPWRIITRHLIPNVLSVVLVSITFDIPGYIFSEAFLSYVGLGIQPPNTSWGALAAMAQTSFTFYPYQMFFPALMIALTMLSFTLLGDGLRDALDPRLRK
ncbi:ABC transporter permease [Dethiosulfovibrio salsuginis]|uniref:Oligopeptide transport system permease protein n=1 Tax=Dethiosulfovibrio salsuginis TaxID=561720 RepID=A0A1X7JVB1_9BACT|nr:ABC transporter permease [Dethiosulfovibrio salsuginis]SMG32148.1 oligopeptide transport system permease protein [Dethiosulfovibrio salsuginis]